MTTTTLPALADSIIEDRMREAHEERCARIGRRSGQDDSTVVRSAGRVSRPELRVAFASVRRGAL